MNNDQGLTSSKDATADSSPETPASYSSVRLPLCPGGPAIANITLSSKHIYHVRETTREQSLLLASPENDALTPLDGGHPPAVPPKQDNSNNVDDVPKELQTYDQSLSSGFFGSQGEGAEVTAQKV